MRRGFFLILLVGACAGCPFMPPAVPEAHSPEFVDLDRRYKAISAHIEPYGPGGQAVLDVAYRVLREGRAEGRWPLVGLEDLWAEAIKEGSTLFGRADRRWGLTSVRETDATLPHNTIGPWQITIRNIRLVYGPPYGVDPEWPETRVYVFCRDHPDVQARMIADYIQEAYASYGRRGPYGIQRYFSLKRFVRGEIGLGPWDASVYPAPSGGDPPLSLAERRANTGFYAKQFLLGTRAQPHGLIYWLWITGDTDAIRRVLRVWRDQRRFAWDDTRERPLLTRADGYFAIYPEDLKYLSAFPDCHAEVERLVREVLSEQEPVDAPDRDAPAGRGRFIRRVVDLEPRPYPRPHQ